MLPDCLPHALHSWYPQWYHTLYHNHTWKCAGPCAQCTAQYPLYTSIFCQETIPGSTSQVDHSYKLSFLYFPDHTFDKMIIISSGTNPPGFSFYWALTSYTYKFIIAVLFTPMVYIIHWCVERYLGKETAAQMKESAMKRY
jgi:hypothetical protein